MTHTRTDRAAIVLEFAGDHRLHHIILDERDGSAVRIDDVSREWIIEVSEHVAKEMFFKLMKIIPDLQEDRR